MGGLEPDLNMNIQIKPMAISVYREVYDLWASTAGIDLSSSDEESEIAAFLDRNPGLSLVARDGAQLAGAVLCGHDGRRGYILHLAISEPYRRRGVGGLLVDRCLEVLRDRGIPKCHLFVFRNNEGLSHSGNALAGPIEVSFP
jgi:ribosomal protein S18 acetylase RimI-like enzyme